MLNSLPWLNSPDLARTALDRAKQPTKGFRRTQPNWTRKPLTNEGLRRLGLLHGSEATAGSSVALTSFGVRGTGQPLREAWVPGGALRGAVVQGKRQPSSAGLSTRGHCRALPQQPECNARMASHLPSSFASRHSSQVLAPNPKALPNQSVELSPNSKGAQPVSGQWHHPLPCRAPLLLGPAHLKR